MFVSRSERFADAMKAAALVVSGLLLLGTAGWFWWWGPGLKPWVERDATVMGRRAVIGPGSPRAYDLAVAVGGADDAMRPSSLLRVHVTLDLAGNEQKPTYRIGEQILIFQHPRDPRRVALRQPVRDPRWAAGHGVGVVAWAVLSVAVAVAWLGVVLLRTGRWLGRFLRRLEC